MISAAPTVKYNNGATTLATSDFFLYPLNALDDDKPYEWLEVLLTATSMSFNDSRQSDITVEGKWGFSEITKAIALINDGSGITATATTVPIDGITVTPEIGMTLLIGSEQLWVENYSSPNITVARGVNGTTAATALDDATISAIFPPMRIRMAANALGARAFMRSDSAWSDRARAGTEVTFTYMKSMPGEVKAILDKYRREVLI